MSGGYCCERSDTVPSVVFGPSGTDRMSGFLYWSAGSSPSSSGVGPGGGREKEGK